ncbi:MAG TPA: TRAP transporter substrate-binding protein [Acidisphaera sp.]|nr:TRAP transporter substrate-binding protein [Acidisphaera sp.]
MMHRRDAMRLGGLAAIAALGMPRLASAQSKLTLKAADVHPEGYPTVAAVESMGKKLDAATGGRITIQMYPSMQLGGEKETIEQTQIGAIQLVRVSVGALGPVIDDLNVLNLPVLFRNSAHMRQTMDGDVGADLLSKVTDNPNAKLVGLCWMDAGARSFYNTKHPIKTIADMHGLKVRVIGNPIFVDMANALGANGIAMGYDQVFSALQTGVIDGAENNPPSYVFDHHYEVAKNYTFTEHLIVPEMLMMSKRTWEGLSKDDQALFRKLAREAQMEARTLWDAKERDALDKAKNANIAMVQIDDKKPWQDAVKPVWDKYGAKYADSIKRIQAVS